MYPWYKFDNYGFKMIATFPRHQWVKLWSCTVYCNDAIPSNVRMILHIQFCMIFNGILCKLSNLPLTFKSWMTLGMLKSNFFFVLTPVTYLFYIFFIDILERTIPSALQINSSEEHIKLEIWCHTFSIIVVWITMRRKIAKMKTNIGFRLNSSCSSNKSARHTILIIVCYAGC